MLPFTPYSAVAVSLIIVSVVIAMTGLVLTVINFAAEGTPYPYVGYITIMALTISAAGIGIISWEWKKHYG